MEHKEIQIPRPLPRLTDSKHGAGAQESVLRQASQGTLMHIRLRPTGLQG